jgi:hypothetical protein
LTPEATIEALGYLISNPVEALLAHRPLDGLRELRG